jgi:hypothetical protein
MLPELKPDDIATVGFTDVLDTPVTEEMREIMRENSRNLEEMLTSLKSCSHSVERRTLSYS